MATVEVAREAGACYGVERALEMTEAALGGGRGRVRTLGPLIHNPRVVESLAERGASVVGDPREAAGCTLVLRTHGVTPAEEALAREACSSVVDATCPFVKKVHRAAERLAAEGYRVVIVGEAGHPEVTATLAHAPGALVVGTAEEALALPRSRKTGVVVQTTQSAARLAEVVSALLSRTEELRVANTICEATSGHQGACAELASRADAMVVIGGRNSANTTRLAEIARAACPRTHHVEGTDELDPSWFEGAGLVGVTAGASTPASQIRAVVTAIESMVGE
ncbi:4-hydroxy-3-methylbut-2-enyl diphosphate reductase [Tractidigestivibacter sp.]|uniref:4-hydroxy-3-methylbut-2-enyl diphosphate reductase n=1 Tax=Tractidigestivibacter sp. TaxID=2847320 RepID=UPI002A90BDDC|nr:4-hydroxy-3-methylbut-2-enyl diphosphate reductase [Tractidigestivibacter sp.]MDY5272421.1 4-hydroxy-3-methylbut-2-enyl diphosphate reductase [Tractidigestivibacter sp.]